MAITMSIPDRFLHCCKEHWISNKTYIRLPATP